MARGFRRGEADEARARMPAPRSLGDGRPPGSSCEWLVSFLDPEATGCMACARPWEQHTSGFPGASGRGEARDTDRCRRGCLATDRIQRGPETRPPALFVPRSKAR